MRFTWSASSLEDGCGGAGAGGGGVNRLIGRDAGDGLDPDFDILRSFQRW
jgi:hypothetical protein